VVAAEDIVRLEDVHLSFGRRGLFSTKFTKQVLCGVSFAVRRGETLGVIGRNGCGKSSLLKVIAGIFTPDTGSVTVAPDTRVSLQTIAAGFDPELSGRDNAVLSSILVGRSKRAALDALDEVQAFSERGDSFFEPVKSYSAGMRSRLGFSVGLTAKADVLLIDEALGVGDERFREKAEREMTSRLRSEQTYVLVSHTLAQVERLCDRVIWLEAGALQAEGAPEEVTAAYREKMIGEGSKHVR
jgi:lipopolysaccharide transport system ATP-binding protein